MDGNATIVFTGWLKGMRKIPFQLLIKEKAGLSLKQARLIKTRILDNEVVELVVLDSKIANEIIEDARALNVVCNLK